MNCIAVVGLLALIFVGWRWTALRDDNMIV
jgi:hypothetical protein